MLKLMSCTLMVFWIIWAYQAILTGTRSICYADRLIYTSSPNLSLWAWVYDVRS